MINCSRNIFSRILEPDSLFLYIMWYLIIFQDDDDKLWRSPGTPVFTAPECCQGTVT
jgi:hypothetical protein